MGLRKNIVAMREHAEEVRQNRDYSANNVAVQAAARYCLRTGKDWQVGYGGRCELGKRALKQWGHELIVAPVQRAWQSKIGRPLMIVLPILAIAATLIAIGMGPFVLGIAIVIAMIWVGTAYALGVMATKNVTKVTSLADYLREYVAEKKGFLKGFVFTAMTLGLPILLLAYALCRLFERFGEYIGLALAGVVVIAILVVIVGQFVTEPIRSLIVVGVIAVAVGIVVGLVKGVTALKKRRSERVYAYERSEENLQRCYMLIEPVLKSTYEVSLSDNERNIVSFAHWTNELNAALKRYGYSWSDLARPRSSVSSLLAITRDADLAFLEIATDEYGITIYLFGSNSCDHRDDFVEALWDHTHPDKVRVIDRKVERKQKRAEVLATLIDLWLSFKMGVCPTVNLPALDQVVETANIPWPIEEDDK